MIDRAAGGQVVGARPLYFSRVVFAWWKRLGAGSIHRQTLPGLIGVAPDPVGMALRQTDLISRARALFFTLTPGRCW